MSDLYNVSTSPHVRSSATTQRIMLDVAIALVPAGAFGIYRFGIKALVLMLVCVAGCVLTEYLYELLMKKPNTITDCSALVTGMLLAYNLPVSMPIWMALIGSIFAILVVKMVFGGLGQNFMNPALGGRCFLVASFGSYMNDFSAGVVDAVSNATDAVSGATPLATLKNGGSVDVMEMFIGNINGTIGEVSALAILIGAGYLLLRRVITLRIPFAYIASFAVFVLLFGGKGFDIEFLAAHLFGGGLTIIIRAIAGGLFQIGFDQLLQHFLVAAFAVIIMKIDHRFSLLSVISVYFISSNHICQVCISIPSCTYSFIAAHSIGGDYIDKTFGGKSLRTGCVHH